MRDRLFIALALGALLAASLPAVVVAQPGPQPGRPGQYELEVLQIGTVDYPHCWAIYADAPYDEDQGLNSIGTGDDVGATVRIVENKNGLTVTCKTIDLSGTWETNAEVGYTDDCYLETPTGDWANGIGKVVKANDRTDADYDNASNVTMTCRFDEGDAVQ